LRNSLITFTARVGAYFDRFTFNRWARYALVGFSTALAYYVLSLFLANCLSLPVGFVGPISYVLTHPLAFLCHSKFTYRTRPTWDKYAKYWAGSLFTFCVTGALSFAGQFFVWGISTTSLAVIIFTPITQVLANELITFRREL
jgi:putative flippase GtrA